MSIQTLVTASKVCVNFVNKDGFEIVYTEGMRVCLRVYILNYVFLFFGCLSFSQYPFLPPLTNRLSTLPPPRVNTIFVSDYLLIINFRLFKKTKKKFALFDRYW